MGRNGGPSWWRWKERMATNCEVMTKLGQNWQRSDCAEFCDKTAEFYNGPITSALHQRRATLWATPVKFFCYDFFHFHCREFRAWSGGLGREGALWKMWFSKSRLQKTSHSKLALAYNCWEITAILYDLEWKLVIVCFAIWEVPKVFWNRASPYKSRCHSWTLGHL